MQLAEAPDPEQGLFAKAAGTSSLFISAAKTSGQHSPSRIAYAVRQGIQSIRREYSAILVALGGGVFTRTVSEQTLTDSRWLFH